MAITVLKRPTNYNISFQSVSRHKKYFKLILLIQITFLPLYRQQWHKLKLETK